MKSKTPRWRAAALHDNYSVFFRNLSAIIVILDQGILFILKNYSKNYQKLPKITTPERIFFL